MLSTLNAMLMKDPLRRLPIKLHRSHALLAGLCKTVAPKSWLPRPHLQGIYIPGDRFLLTLTVYIELRSLLHRRL